MAESTVKRGGQQAFCPNANKCSGPGEVPTCYCKPAAAPSTGRCGPRSSAGIQGWRTTIPRAPVTHPRREYHTLPHGPQQAAARGRVVDRLREVKGSDALTRRASRRCVDNGRGDRERGQRGPARTAMCWRRSRRWNWRQSSRAAQRRDHRRPCGGGAGGRDGDAVDRDVGLSAIGCWSKMISDRPKTRMWIP